MACRDRYGHWQVFLDTFCCGNSKNISLAVCRVRCTSNNTLTCDPFRNTGTRDPSIQSLEHSAKACTHCKIAAIATVRYIKFTSAFSMYLAATLRCAGRCVNFHVLWKFE